MPSCGFAAMRFTLCLYLIFTIRFFAADLPQDALLGDSFTVPPYMWAANSDLKGRKTEIGNATWDVFGHVFITRNGAVSADTESMAITELPKFDGAVNLSADIVADGSGFTGLIFMPGGSMGGFWNAASFWIFLQSNGHYEIRAFGGKTLLKKGEGGDYGFKPGTLTHVELICDPGAETTAVKLNGVAVLSNTPLKGMLPVTHVALRFNGSITSGEPRVSNFAVTPAPSVIRLKSVSSLQFYINPDQASTLSWTYSTYATGTVTDVVVRDFTGKDISHLKTASTSPGNLDVSVNLPQGYYTLFFPEVQQEFGLMVIPAFSGKPDPFFGIDMALSQLVPFSPRENLVAIVKRGGLDAGRERLSWGQIEPEQGQWSWEAARQNETTRQLYQKAGVGVLELFAGSPRWMEKDWRAFPYDLITTEKSWESIGTHFQPYWHGLEAWNEPDTVGSGTNSPADQYLPIVKAIHYAFHAANISTPIGGGVFAYTNKPYLDLAARNGLLEQSDFLSFHYYGEANNLQGYIQEYRAYLAMHGNESMPLWITEMGPPWLGTPGMRAPPSDDAARGLKFARNAVEARACGIAEIYPFVLVDYSEHGSRVFGMLDSGETPLRPLGTYLEAIQMLAGTTYIGDLKSAPGSRVFQRDAHTAVVAYLPASGAIPAIAITEMRGIDGRLLTAPADGMTYLTVSTADVDPLLDKDTVAMKLNHMAAKTNAKLAIPSPLVLMPSVQDTSALKSVRGYQIAEDAATVHLHLRVVNFEKEAAPVKLTFSSVSPTGGADVPLDTKDLTVPPGGDAATDVEIPVSKLQLDESGSGIVQITGPEGVSPAAVCFILARGLKEQLSSHPYQFSLPISELTRWKDNTSGHGNFSKTDDGGWVYDITFNEGDKWAYPRFTPPQEVDLSRVSSILVRARCTQPAEVKAMIFSSSTAKESHTPFAIIKADGNWHVAFIPLDGMLQPVEGQPIGKQISSISIGMNSEAATNRLEVSDLYLLGN